MRVIQATDPQQTGVSSREAFAEIDARNKSSEQARRPGSSESDIETRGAGKEAVAGEDLDALIARVADLVVEGERRIECTSAAALISNSFVKLVHERPLDAELVNLAHAWVFYVVRVFGN